MSERRTRRGGAWQSLVFGALALVLAVIAVIVYVRGENEADRAPTPPPAAAGHNELIHVVNALQQEGLEVRIEPRSIPRGELSVPGQVLTVDGARLYVFVYPDAAQAEAEAARADPSAVLPERSPSGTPIATEPPHLASHSNVTAALVGGSAEVAEKVDRAVEGLP